MNIRFYKKSALGLSLFLMTAMSPVMASTICYDFNNVEDVTTKWSPGYTQTLSDGSTMEIHYARTLDGQQIINEAQFAKISATGIAAGDANEFHAYFANLQLNLASPKSQVTMQFAQYGTSTGGYLYSTLAANRERVQLENGLESANGLVLGVNSDEQVKISTVVTEAPLPGEGGFHKGTLTFDALTSGGINSLTLGGVQNYFDNICFSD